MSNDNIKRVNLRINIDDPIDEVVWEYIKDERKKGTYIKKLIYDIATRKPPRAENVIKKNTINYRDIEEDELDSSGMEGF